MTETGGKKSWLFSHVSEQKFDIFFHDNYGQQATAVLTVFVTVS